jgi:rubredoxin
LRRFSCIHCGDPFDAYAPDQEHNTATRDSGKYSNSIRVNHKCRNCGHDNLIYWGDIGASPTGVNTAKLPSIGEMSNWWYVVAVLFGFLVGLLGFAHGYRKHPERAKAVLLTGFLSSVIVYVLLLIG